MTRSLKRTKNIKYRIVLSFDSIFEYYISNKDLNYTLFRFQLPIKKRKFVEISSNEDPEIEALIRSFMTKLTIDDDIREIPVIPKIDLPIRITEISKNIYNLLQTDKICLKIRPKIKTKKICFPANEQETVTLLTVLDLFKNCVNFIHLRGCVPIADIDIIVRCFSDFGKVLTIQDHWVQKRGISQFTSYLYSLTLEYDLRVVGNKYPKHCYC